MQGAIRRWRWPLLIGALLNLAYQLDQQQAGAYLAQLPALAGAWIDAHPITATALLVLFAGAWAHAIVRAEERRWHSTW